MVDGDDIPLQVYVPKGQSAEFRNAHARMEQDVNCLIVFAVDDVIMDEFQELPHLLPLQLESHWRGRTIFLPYRLTKYQDSMYNLYPYKKLLYSFSELTTGT